MEHYVTLFDSAFLPQGLALHMSMERCVGPFCLWILCVDSIAYTALSKIALRNVRLINLSDVETAELLQVKPLRSHGEYCWTLTPFAPRFVFELDTTVNRITYLDADTWFRKPPVAIFEEFEASHKYVLITDHAYSPEYDKSAISGQYCVQFVTFLRDRSETVRQWWEDRCIEWCFNRVEDGKFGDQKYLDLWPSLFEDDVHILKNKELMLAPWNATRFPYGNAVLWHFHGFRISIRSKTLSFDYGPYRLPRPAKEHVYKSYLRDIRASLQLLKSHDICVTNQVQNMLKQKLKTFLTRVYYMIV